VTNIVSSITSHALCKKCLIPSQLFASPSMSQCYYPDHSVATCLSANPCAFQCMDGFTAYPPDRPTMCQCPSPSVVCNGQCVPQGACPSQKPSTARMRWVGSGGCAERGDGWRACGVYGGHARVWECIDTYHELESCESPGSWASWHYSAPA
jgi:hypothetical protein